MQFVSQAPQGRRVRIRQPGTEALKEQVHRLESQIQELENPRETTPSVTLQEPYSPAHQLSLSPHISPTSHAGISLSASISPYQTTPASTESPSLLNRLHALPIKSSSSGGSRASLLVADRKPFLVFEEADISVIRVLLDNFLPHPSEFGFFLSTSWFYNAALVPTLAGHVTRPLPALLFAVYLFGMQLLHGQQPGAVEHIPQSGAADLQRRAHLRPYPAKYHAAAASSLIISSGLHKSNPVADAIEDGERISALWSTFALEPPDALCSVFDVPGVQIDTPWPLTMKEYEDRAMPENLQSTVTVQNFVTNNDWYPSDGSSGAALFVKAVILIHRAAYIAGRHAASTTVLTRCSAACRRRRRRIQITGLLLDES
ncbi:hypothetical protein FB107DRAFT_280328 [Schizophyllum commune]